MIPTFASWSDFFAIGGCALYVRLAVAMSVIPLVVLAPRSVLRHRAILRGVTQQWAKEACMRATQMQQETA